MDEQVVRERAEAVCAALVAGDVARATQDFSEELRRNLGEVLALLPLPSSEVTIDAIERGGRSGFAITLRLVGETEEVQVQTRWKERDGRPVMVEASHLSRTEMAAPDVEPDGGEAAAADET